MPSRDLAGVKLALAVALFGQGNVSLGYAARIAGKSLPGMMDLLTHMGIPIVKMGALSGARPPERPSFDLGSAADRVWYAAALFKAGRASWVLVSGGNQPGADAVDGCIT